MIKYDADFEILWKYINGEAHSLVLTLHNDDSLLSIIKTFDYKSFIIHSAINLRGGQSFQDLFLSLSFVWEKISVEDLHEIIETVACSGKYEPTLNILTFIGKYFEIDSLKILSNLQMDKSNFAIKTIFESKERLCYMFYIDEMDEELIQESNIDITVFNTKKSEWVSNGATILPKKSTSKLINIYRKIHQVFPYSFRLV